MNTYGDTDQRPNTRRNTIPLCRCGSSGRMIEDDFGYTVVCTNKNCRGSRMPTTRHLTQEKPPGVLAVQEWREQMSNQPSEAALEAAKEVIVTLQESYGIEYKGGEPVDNSDWHYWANTLDAFAAQAVAAERARCLEILCYPRKHFSAAYPDWMVWLIELDIRNGVEQPKRGE